MSSEAIKHISDASFETDVLKSGTPVLVDYWAEWCGPCKAIAPILEEVAKDYGQRLQIAKMNVDDNRDVPAKFGIRGIPTLMLFKDGQLAATKVGALSKSQLNAFLEGHLGAAPAAATAARPTAASAVSTAVRYLVTRRKGFMRTPGGVASRCMKIKRNTCCGHLSGPIKGRDGQEPRVPPATGDTAIPRRCRGISPGRRAGCARVAAAAAGSAPAPRRRRGTARRSAAG